MTSARSPRNRAWIAGALVAWAACPLVGCTRVAAVGEPATDSAPTASTHHLSIDPNPQYLRPGESRTFEIRYRVQVSDIPSGARRLRIWVPVPRQVDGLQAIRDLTFEGPVEPRLTRDPQYGNHIAYFEIAEPAGAEVDLVMQFVATRREQVTDLGAVAQAQADSSAAALRFLAPDRLVLLDERVRELAEEAVRGRAEGALTQARGIYDYVGGWMEYSYEGEGWGRGDTAYACDARSGNCTDYHSLFNAMARVADIPSAFEIGLPLPYDWDEEAELSGYHCWAHFQVPGVTWVPVDVSEGDKHPERREYFFGAVGANRVSLSVGRDIVLEPPQQGQPINFFVNPYAEADGEPVTATKTWWFRDLPPDTQ